MPTYKVMTAWDEVPTWTKNADMTYVRFGYRDFKCTFHEEYSHYDPEEVCRGYVYFTMSEWELFVHVGRSAAAPYYMSRSQDEYAMVIDTLTMQPSGFLVKDFVVTG